jgi:hypothetical protein
MTYDPSTIRYQPKLLEEYMEDDDQTDEEKNEDEEDEDDGDDENPDVGANVARHESDYI